MCGILGFATSNPSADNMKYLKKILYLSAIRGTDATGIAYVKDGKVIIEKDSIDANDFIKKLLPKHEDDLSKINIALGHTRTPTVGTPKNNNNNHPLENDKWVLIHNGSVTGMTRLKDYQYKGEVDSEVLLSYINEYGLEKGLPYVGRTGTAAVAVIDKSEPNAIYLWRETNPIQLAYDEQSDTIFFASQEDFLTKSLTNKLVFFSTFKLRDLPENLLIKITTNPLVITPINYVEVLKPPVKIISTTATSSYVDKYYKNLGIPDYNGNISKSYSLGLQFNSTTKRWEEKPEVKSALSSTKADELPTLNSLIDTSTLKNRYYIKDQSRDFKGWYKLTAPNRGYISLDGELIKKWDVNVAQHYVMMVNDALKEKLLDGVTLQRDIDDAFGYLMLDEQNNVPKELMS